jgi:hypothetical protein
MNVCRSRRRNFLGSAWKSVAVLLLGLPGYRTILLGVAYLLQGSQLA